MILTHIKTGKKYQVGAKKIKSDTTEYTRPDGYKKQIITDTYAKQGSSKPKTVSKSTTVSKSASKPTGAKKMAPKGYTETKVREFFPEANKMEPRKPMFTKIDATPSTAKITKVSVPKSTPPKYETPKSKPLNKVKGQKYRDEYQVPTGNKGNKPTMSASDRKKGGGKNKLKIGI